MNLQKRKDVIVILIYDFEVFKHDTLLGVLDEETRRYNTTVEYS